MSRALRCLRHAKATQFQGFAPRWPRDEQALFVWFVASDLSHAILIRPIRLADSDLEVSIVDGDKYSLVVMMAMIIIAWGSRYVVLLQGGLLCCQYWS